MRLQRDKIMQRWNYSLFAIYSELHSKHVWQSRLERGIGERGQRTFSFFPSGLLLFFLCLSPRISIVNLIPRSRDPFVQRRVVGTSYMIPIVYQYIDSYSAVFLLVYEGTWLASVSTWVSWPIRISISVHYRNHIWSIYPTDCPIRWTKVTEALGTRLVRR